MHGNEVAARKAEILAGQEEAQEVQEVETERVTSTFHGGRPGAAELARRSHSQGSRKALRALSDRF